jgi:general secretion pathway protein D/MSHA biogenesis protein MshL
MGDSETTAMKIRVMSVLKRILPGCAALAILAVLCSCAPIAAPAAREAQAASAPAERLKAAPMEDVLEPAAVLGESGGGSTLPARFQQPSYAASDVNASTLAMEEKDVAIPVGADISTTTGSVPLRDIIKRLAEMKGMNISWASDVNQWGMVDVDIRAEDDFFESITNLLRQIDYYHVVEGNTIVVNYKETRRFQIAMPFLASQYNTGVGGDVLGNKSSGNNVVGNVKLTSEANNFDVWANIQSNLNNILQTWESEQSQKDSTVAQASEAAVTPAGETGTQPAATKAKTGSGSSRIGKGYYTIDKPIGLITVTAPRPVQKKVADYISTLKKQLYRQISIEAKIVEVVLQNDSNTGVDWSKLLLSSNFDFNITFGNIEMHNPLGDNRSLTLNSKAFSLVIDALQTQGETRILSNPKISVMNGQPALINVGEDQTYVSKVETTTTSGAGNPVTTFTVTTDSVFSGLGLGVVATIMENDEIILNLMPVTSQLQELTYETFGGSNGSRVGLPVVKLRELNTTVRVQDGGMLVVGGMIDSEKGQTAKKVPFLGNIPLIKNLFRSDAKKDGRKELIILMRPKIIS